METGDNRRLLLKLIVVALGMFAFGFALVPFYEKICEVTDNNAVVKKDVVRNTQVRTDRLVKVTFDSNIRDNLPVVLTPPHGGMQIHPGKLYQLEYEIENRSAERLKIQAIPGYAPLKAASHFKKLECFCFRQQVLEPNEKRKLPVVFVVDSELPDDVFDLTLSYTVFRVAGVK